MRQGARQYGASPPILPAAPNSAFAGEWQVRAVGRGQTLNLLGATGTDPLKKRHSWPQKARVAQEFTAEARRARSKETEKY